MNITHPLGRFSNHDFSTTERVPIPNDTASERSRRDGSNADLRGNGTIPTAVEISTTENRPRGVWCDVLVVHSIRYLHCIRAPGIQRKSHLLISSQHDTIHINRRALYIVLYIYYIYGVYAVACSHNYYDTVPGIVYNLDLTADVFSFYNIIQHRPPRDRNFQPDFLDDETFP